MLCSITFFWKLCHLWDNVEKCSRAGQGTDDNIIGCMCFACWVNTATNTCWEYVILIIPPWQQRSHEHTSVVHHTYIACIVKISLILSHLFMFRSSKWSLPFRFPNKSHICFSLLPHTCHIPYLALPPCLYCPLTIWLGSTNHEAPHYAVLSILRFSEITFRKKLQDLNKCTDCTFWIVCLCCLDGKTFLAEK